MTNSQLRAVIKAQLKFFNRNKIEITDTTVIEDVLSHDFNNAKRLFQGNVRWTVKNATGQGKSFPKNWLTLNVQGLAGRLLVLFFILLTSFTSQAQLKVNIGTARTDLSQTAVNIAFSYLRNLDSLYGGQELMGYGKKSYFLVSPDVEFRTGTEDAFSAIVVKASGLWTHFRTTNVEGIETPDASKTLHVFPISLGAETNNRFDFVNGLVEVGYQPYYQGEGDNTPEIIKHTKFGVYLQGGYKFNLDSAATLPEGGNVDESSEEIASAIFRAKGHFSVDTKGGIRIGGFNIGLVGNSNVWRDFRNNEWYYQIQGIGRVYLTPTTFFDVEYSKGSGAPLFNTGDQFGVGLTLQF